MKILRATLTEFLSSPWRLDLLEAARDYLVRSREELSPDEESKVLLAAVTEVPGLALLIAVDDIDGRLLGFCLARLVPGPIMVGPVVQLWQAYAWPGRARLKDLFTAALPYLEALATEWGAKTFALLTRRVRLQTEPERAWIDGAYHELLESLGFQFYEAEYRRVME